MKNVTKHLMVCLATSILLFLSCSENQFNGNDQLSLEETVNFIKSNENFRSLQSKQASVNETLKTFYKSLTDEQKSSLKSLTKSYERSVITKTDLIASLKENGIDFSSLSEEAIFQEYQHAHVLLIKKLLTLTSYNIAWEALKITFLESSAHVQNERAKDAGYEWCSGQAGYHYSLEIYECIYGGHSDGCLNEAKWKYTMAHLDCLISLLS
ncbi:MAG: hypothetical protein KF845_07065 [Cyclobacteriaceae bacterium]|nr:hypothetical protein [Cyclobacteriaceae bacterium]